jgi:hypothetical protein
MTKITPLMALLVRKSVSLADYSFLGDRAKVLDIGYLVLVNQGVDQSFFILDRSRIAYGQRPVLRRLTESPPIA